MYLIVVYDVETKRNPKVLKLLRKYLFRVQNSVFEGELTPSKYKELKDQLSSIIKDNTNDKIMIYKLLTKNNLQTERLGSQELNNLIL